MSELTTNYNLVKPGYADTADIMDINGNMDIIDSAMKGIDDSKQSIADESLTTTEKNIPGAINELDADIELKQDITDNSLETSEKTVPGAINELNTAVGLKQNISDNSLATTAKTVPGAINELHGFVSKSFTASTRNSFQNALVAWGDTMSDASVGVAYTYPNFSDSIFDGSPQPTIMVRRQSGVYRVAFPCLCVDGYYYSGSWHWRMATMSNV